MQRLSIEWLPEQKQENARRHLIAQNKFARKIGLPLVRLTLLAVVLSVTGTLTYLGVLEMLNRGMLDVPVQQPR